MYVSADVHVLYVCVSSYLHSKADADAVEKGHMANSGPGLVVSNTVPNLQYISKYLVPVNYINSNGTPGDYVAPGSSLVLPRAAADARG
jgi:hypothetical protein